MENASADTERAGYSEDMETSAGVESESRAVEMQDGIEIGKRVQ
jgi:hypothetical protein